MNLSFVPLKITTEYSLLNSTIKINDLITFLKEHNITSCAITDDNLYGVMEFYHKMIENNLKPIIGLSIEVEGYPMILYAKNLSGYKNLLKIHTKKELKELNFLELNKYLENLKIVLPRTSFELLATYKEAYLGYDTDETKIEALLKSKNIVYLKDIRGLHKENLKYLRYLKAIKKGCLLKDVEEINNYSYPIKIKEEDIKTTSDFIADINIELEFHNRYIPRYKDDINSYDYLYNLAHKGLMKRLNNELKPEYLTRLNYELNIIKNMGFVDYFLIVYDYVLYAKKNNILVGPGRGSAAGSLVSYSIGITNVDPLKYDLLFERFLNPERVTMPDIDIDFEYTKRGLVIDYVRDRYGANKVAPIMTFGTMGSKQVIRDVGRILDIEPNLIDGLANLIDAKTSLKENSTKPEIKEYLKRHSNIFTLYQDALKIEGLKRHISTHAAGIVISSIPLDDVIPIIYNGEFIMTGVTMEYLEELGLLKMDFLALRNLTIIGNVLELIKNNKGISLDLNKIDLEDKEIFKLFCTADTEGIFQYESSGMKNLLLKLKPSSFSDLIAAVALFRPGPMNNIDLFIKRKYGLEKINYLAPELEPILKETYGVIVYQEQVMQILVKIGGYTYAEADNIRRAMSKKKENVMLKDKEHFLENAIKRGYKKETATAIYDLILKFANYGFNKAHSVSYALIGYRMAYLKVKFPIYFIANLLNMSIGSEIKTKEYIEEAKKKNISILKPDINRSDSTFLIKDNSLVLPLGIIKNLGSSATKIILDERKQNGKYLDYLDFIARVYGKSVNKKTIISLIEAGVLDSFSLNKRTMIENIDIAINYADLVSNLDPAYCMKPIIEPVEEYNEQILREKELNSFGFYIRNHPASKYSNKNIMKMESKTKYFDKHIECVVLIEKIRKIKTKKGDDMAFITASDETGDSEFILFPKAYYMLNNIQNGELVNIRGRVTKRLNQYQISIDFINKIEM